MRTTHTAVVDGREIGRARVTPPGPGEPARISDLEVHPAYRNQGHAGRIVAAAERDLQKIGVPRIELELDGTQDTARRFFSNRGYKLVAQHRRRQLHNIPPTDLRLIPLPKENARLEALIAEYAADLQEDERLPPPEARRVAEQRLAELNPQDPDHFLCTLTAREREIGWIWAGPPRGHHQGMGWLYQLEIDPPHQRKGFGAQAMAAVQHELRRRGFTSIGLNVHAENLTARRLYDRLGLTVVKQRMAKTLLP